MEGLRCQADAVERHDGRDLIRRVFALPVTGFDEFASNG